MEREMVFEWYCRRARRRLWWRRSEMMLTAPCCASHCYLEAIAEDVNPRWVRTCPRYALDWFCPVERWWMNNVGFKGQHAKQPRWRGESAT